MCPDDGFHGWWNRKRLREAAIGHLPFASLPEAIGFTRRRELTERPLIAGEKIVHSVHHPDLPVPDSRSENPRATLEVEAMCEFLADRSIAATEVPHPEYTPSSDEIRFDRRYAIAAELSNIDKPTSKFLRWLDTLDDEDTLRDYLCHMLDRCPWLSNDWERPGLSKRDRSLITVPALIALYRTDQLRGHIGRALKRGLPAS